MPDVAQKRSLWKRLALGSLLVVLVTAAASSAAFLNETGTIAHFLGQNHLNLGPGSLDPVAAGRPQTILLIGSDQRAASATDAKIFGSGARSDTMILARLDPSKQATALLSLPRDLKVDIPGRGVNKLNAAYAMGGTKLALKTIKQVTGIPINHVINIDFRGFRDAVNAIHCVYADVDRHYLNVSGAYAKINIQAGYQKMCGPKALAYVRYRHTDNDIVRAARQQDFLRQAKSQVGVGRLLDNRTKLAQIFGKYTQSDIHRNGDVLKLLDLVVASAGHPIREIHFNGHIGPSFVTATPQDIAQAKSELLGVQASNGPRGPVQKKPGAHKRKHRRGHVTGLVGWAGPGRDQALGAVRQGVRGMHVFYPTQLVAGASLVPPTRVYEICGPQGRCWSSYRMVFSRDLIGEYYGFQGTRWRNPPILDSPTKTVNSHGQQYMVFMDGDRVRLVGWRTADGAYWVSNTLLQTLSTQQMLTLARTARALG